MMVFMSSYHTELKAVLQRSPIRYRGHRGDLPTCTEYPSSWRERPTAQEGEDLFYVVYKSLEIIRTAVI